MAPKGKNAPLTKKKEAPVTVAPVAPKPAPLFPSGYKTPLSLLSERCQKNGWEKPDVVQKKVAGSTEAWTATVTLRRKNPKTGSFDSVFMKPPTHESPIAVLKITANEAKHYAAMYALYRFSNNLRLNLQLPPQTRDYWAALEKEKADSSSNKAWLWSTTPFDLESDPKLGAKKATNSGASTPRANDQSTKPSLKTAATRLLPKIWQNAPELKMSTQLRSLVESTIQESMKTSAINISAKELDITADEQAVIDELLSQGFRKGHILNGLAYIQSALSNDLDPVISSIKTQSLTSSMQNYLLLHVPEEDLPLRFRSSKPSDSLLRLTSNQNGTTLAQTWLAEQISGDTGFPLEIVQKKVEESSDQGLIIHELISRLVGLNPELGGVVHDEKKQKRENEFLALEGVFGSEMVEFSPQDDSQFDGTISAKISAEPDISLVVLFHETSNYPSPAADFATASLPTFYVKSTSLPPYIVLHLTSSVASQFLSPERDDWRDLACAGEGGLVMEMVSYLTENWQEKIDYPPSMKELMARFNATAMVREPKVPEVALETKKAGKTSRRNYKVSENELEEIAVYLEHVKSMDGYQTLMQTRKALPAYSMRKHLVDLIKSNRVTIVSGETGSGKTTQVPSFVLEDCVARKEYFNAVVTQPRRVSAIGVASRVSNEFVEDVNLITNESLVGYAIRGERKAGSRCRLLFCTTGVMLRRLSKGNDPDLEQLTHVFIDEVHERSIDSDFLLVELREILKRNPRLKIILMSATINQKQFSDYFGGAPWAEIPGITHPVKDFYLEDIIPHLPPIHISTKKSLSKKTAQQLEVMRETFKSHGVVEESHLNTLEYLSRSQAIDYNIVGATAAFCLNRSKDDSGGLLVFMPGVFEIAQAIEAIKSHVSSGIEIFPLHSNLSTAEQAAIFRPTKCGIRKVVVATNIAETSITIDGMVYVIDCGRVKENTLDLDSLVVRLQETWTSKAASKQRRGRAGRTRPGECYKLFSHWVEDNVMVPYPQPEILRTPLEQICLQIKAIRDDSDVMVYLQNALTPPHVRAIQAAWDTLERVGAVESKDTSAMLTPLGRNLSLLPIDIRLGKMLILSTIFRCLDPMLTIAALLSSKPLFITAEAKRNETKRARKSYYTANSDIITDFVVFEACREAQKQSNRAFKDFAEENSISMTAYRDVLQLKYEYLIALCDAGMLPVKTSSSAPEWNSNSMNQELLKSVFFGGTERVVKCQLPETVFDKGSSGAIQRDREAKEVKFFEREGRVFLHPGSLLFEETSFSSSQPLFTYFHKHVTTKPFLRDATEVPTYGSLLFGPRIRIHHDLGLEIGEGGWFVLRAWPRIGVLVNTLRSLLDEEIDRLIETPDWNAASPSSVVEAMIALLSSTQT